MTVSAQWRQVWDAMTIARVCYDAGNAHACRTYLREAMHRRRLAKGMLVQLEAQR